ncbi:EAL domain-containing protein [candidate division KSB3 bacterium]|uniref:EAL domain-containing protein n=1 Tax=candidate division KSB3 bacterium TaxID=2044937 RepID=A0A9D5JTC1_9BACT|nr:EAL domain-containing protein [candidate division KSB3 bacterium]MBD3323602.1 EAL domain-containing protein [candidate division KSB3 bacterium]
METFQPDLLRILAVDDEQTALRFYQRVLFAETPAQHTSVTPDELEAVSFEDQPHSPSLPPVELVTCTQARRAVDIVKQALEDDQPFSVIFMDVRMPPGPDGIWAAEQIRALDPHVEIVIVTGYSDVTTQAILQRVPPIHKLLYLQKPLYAEEVSQFASALALKWQTEHELRKLHEELERWLGERTVELMHTNEHLQKEIEERERIQSQLQKSEERHRIVLESAPDPVMVCDMKGRVTYLNPAFSRVFGWTLQESQGQNIDFIPTENLPEIRSIFTKINRGETVSGIETYLITKQGTRVDVSISGAGFFDVHGKPQGSVITIQDITERKRTEEEIRFIAYHDALTGLPNRKSFYMRLEDKLIQSSSYTNNKRRATPEKWALLFLDLDRFKYVNDTLGHDVGDELLQSVATRLEQCVRKSDYIFRLGGDEFTMLLSHLAYDTDVAKVAQKIGDELARPHHLKNHELYITVSIGISVYPTDGDSVEALVKNADMAMYAAKEEHQGYRFFTEEMNRKALERMRLESNLRNALQDNQFVLYYQPLVDDHRRIIGMEALLRWHHPELGVISPATFIPLAEETGAIVAIGKWVLYTACQQAKRWHEKGQKEFYVAVNLSTRQFKEPDLVDTVIEVLETTGLPPECLKLEVTESGIMEDPEQAIIKMQQLRAQGIHFSIDDFGTGYSSLSYLKRFPIDTLKIDRSFVMDSTTNKDDQEIIKTIISMAHNLNMTTVAEGVETEEQQSFLTLHGCRMMQGYYFGRPMPADDFEQILQTPPEQRKNC